MSVSVINIDLPTSSEPCDIKSSALSSSSQPIFLDPTDMPATSRSSRQRSSKGAQQSEDNVIDLSQEEDEPVSPRKRQRTSSVGNRSRRGSRQPLEALSPSLCDNWGNSKKRMTVQQAKRNNNDKDGDDDEVQVVEAPMKLTATRRSSGNVKQEHSIQTRQSFSSSQPKPTQKPRKGDRFRVFYDIGDDAFGTERAGGKGWHFGHVISVKRSKTPYEVRIHFDNGEKSTFDYPAKDNSVERLVPSQTGQTILEGEFERDFAMDSNPAILDVGDLVQCLYQDGAARGRWFRGRVAFLSEDSKYCDVAYDDGDYECGVPVGENKICLVQDGRMFQHWLDGLKVFIPVGPSKRKTEMTIKILLDEDGKIGLVHSDGRMVERRYYKDVVRELFGAFKGQAQTILKWPTRILPDPKETTREVAPIEKTVVNKRRKKAPIKKNAVSGECCQAEDFEVDPWLVEPLVEDEQEPEKEEDNPVAMKEMTNSLRNSCWKILNSAEGSYGAELLFKITEFHNKMPNDELCQDLIQLLWKGPAHAKGRVHFPDCVRMELANKYLLLLRSKQGMGTKLAKALPQGFWTECLDTIMQPASVYCVEDDESRTTSAALTRVGQTLNVKNSGANLFCYLLQHQLRGYSQLKNDSVSKQQLAGFKSLLKSRALPSNILSSKDGISNGLKRAVRAAFSVLIHYGHYLSNDFCFPDPPAKNDADGSLTPPHATVADRSFVATEVRKLVETMGRIVSYMSWLWAVEEEQSIYDAKYLISGTVINQLEDSKFYPSVFLTGVSPKEKEKQMNRHWADMKLQFALSLDKRISGLLGQKVADEFRVVTKYF